MCEPKSKIDEWLTKMNVFLIVDSDQVAMKNRTTPIQKYKDLFVMKLDHHLILELGPNEFTDKTDRFGLFSSSEPDSHNFLTVEREERIIVEKQPAPKISIKLSSIKHEYERSAFTLMMVLGELGGIYGAIVSIPSLFIS